MYFSVYDAIGNTNHYTATQFSLLFFSVCRSVCPAARSLRARGVGVGAWVQAAENTPSPSGAGFTGANKALLYFTLRVVSYNQRHVAPGSG